MSARPCRSPSVYRFGWTGTSSCWDRCPGHAMHTIFVDDLDARVEEIAGRGIEPAEREWYSNGVRKVTYRDPDGNEIGLGGAPLTR